MQRLSSRKLALLGMCVLAAILGARVYSERPESFGESAQAQGAKSNITLLGRLIYGEARGEPYLGQVAVGAVVINRTAHPRFPKTLAGVIFQPGAFDAVSDGQIWRGLKNQNLQAAQAALSGWDPTGGSLFYWNPATATSRWIWSRKIVARIGKHVFGI